MDLRRIVIPVLAIGMFLGNAQADAQETKTKSKYEQLIAKKTKLTGMWTVYYSDQQFLVELSSTALKQEYIVLPSISKGISRGNVLGGMSWGFGDDVIYSFKATTEKVYINQRNVRFTAKANSPEASAVKLAYRDSILFALPVLTKSPSGGVLVDMTRVFMNDDQQIGRAIGSGFRLMTDRSTFSKVKLFKKNLELEINAVYAGSGSIDTVPNSKGIQVGIHLSLSVLPPVGSNGYKPRVADDRIGYFLTAIKDFSDKKDPDHFKRYINRWDLRKLDPSIKLSPPKKPIRFYMENTVPVYLRPTVEAGIMEWNKAYEKLGFSGAVRVDQQPNDPNFDPESIEYNTFRWITAEAGFAMGPSRVDPRTGQILDADIIFDASFLDSWSHRWEIFRPEDIDALMGFADPFSQGTHQHSPLCALGHQMQRQSAFASAVFFANGAAKGDHLPEDFIHQGLKEVVMHEVGHTLGLRHNFKASTWKTLAEIADPEADKSIATVASVMDYSPANVVVDKDKQGLYYSQTIGPYDYWAIEYGYKPIKANELVELKKIAARSGEPALDYGTDEDTRSIDPDPNSNRFDLGKDPLNYVRRQMAQSIELLPKVIDNTVHDGDGYQRARQAFGLLFGEYWRAISFASRFPGGVYVSRDHKGDKDAQAPFIIVPAEKQREAMKLVAASAFDPPSLNGSQLNFLSASRWNHWGAGDVSRLDYPIHDVMLRMQDRVLSSVLNPLTLERILDNEFKVEADEDAYTLAEHMTTIVSSLFTEFKQNKEAKYTNREPLISSFRRNLQRKALRRLGTIVSHGSGVPSDARTLTRMHLITLKKSATSILKNKKVTLDDYSKAHILESISIIETILDAKLSLPSVY